LTVSSLEDLSKRWGVKVHNLKQDNEASALKQLMTKDKVLKQEISAIVENNQDNKEYIFIMFDGSFKHWKYATSIKDEFIKSLNCTSYDSDRVVLSFISKRHSSFIYLEDEQAEKIKNCFFNINSIDRNNNINHHFFLPLFIPYINKIHINKNYFRGYKINFLEPENPNNYKLFKLLKETHQPRMIAVGRGQLSDHTFVRSIDQIISLHREAKKHIREETLNDAKDVIRVAYKNIKRLYNYDDAPVNVFENPNPFIADLDRHVKDPNKNNLFSLSLQTFAEKEDGFIPLSLFA
ncbi:MAG: hypothetical protein ACOC1K_04635, partial [Nanoarchaeota archaeon]